MKEPFAGILKVAIADTGFDLAEAGFDECRPLRQWPGCMYMVISFGGDYELVRVKQEFARQVVELLRSSESEYWRLKPLTVSRFVTEYNERCAILDKVKTKVESE